MDKQRNRQKKPLALPTSKLSKSVQHAKVLDEGHVQSCQLAQGLCEKTKPEKVALREAEAPCKASSAVVANCQGPATSINPAPQLSAALKSAQWEKDQKAAAEQGSQQKLCESTSAWMA